MPYRRILAVAVLALGAARSAAAQRPVSLVAPREVVRAAAADVSADAFAVLAYRAPGVTSTPTLDVIDPKGRVVITWGGRGGSPLFATPLDSVSWNLRYPGIAGADSGQWIPGPKAPPGRYLVRLRAGADVDSTWLVVRGHPQALATRMDYGEQLAFQLRVRARLSQAATALRASRALRADVADRDARVPDSLRTRFDMIRGVLVERVDAAEAELHRADGTGVADRLAALLLEADVTDGHPSDAQYSTFMQQQIRLDQALERLQGTYAKYLPFVNATLTMAGLDPVPPGAALATR